MITALGIGTKQAPDNVNLDPQRQFWSWLMAFRNYNDPNYVGTASQCVYFNGFRCRQNDPAGMSVLIGGEPETDSAALDLPGGRMVLLSTDGTPETVTIPTAPASGSRIDAIVSYIDTTSADPEAETPGTPEYVHTIVVSGTAASSPSAPTTEQIVSALPAGAGGQFYRWCDVRVAQGATTITNSNITDKKPASPKLYWTNQQIKDIADSSAQTAVAPYVNWGKRKSITFSAGYGKQWNIQRVGNLVVVVSGGGNGFQTQTGTWQKVDEVLPVGYRPIVNARVMGYCPPFNLWQQTVSPNGSMQSMVERTDSSTDYTGIGVWFTNDSWPN